MRQIRTDRRAVPCPRAAACCCALVVLLGTLVATASARANGDLADLSLEELLEVEVVSASKRAESLSETVHAAFVLTHDDLRQLGVTTLVDALAWVPGTQFARLNASNAAVSVRGFNGVLADKLLVLIDGRSVYSMFFSGVYWDEQDLMIEDVERIEVIRGPGGTVWGSNAVNGVINVVTRSAEDTRGWALSSGGGNTDRLAALRYGQRLGHDTDGRLWVKWHRRDAFDRAAAHYDGGGLETVRLGFRIDRRGGRGRSLMVQGQVHGASTDRQDLGVDFATASDTILPEAAHEVGGGALLARWQRPVGRRTDLALQGWISHENRDERIFGDRRTTADAELQLTHRRDRHRIVGGVSGRLSRDELSSSATYSFEPREGSLHWISAFVQDEISFFDDRVRLVPGTKIEYNDFTGWEWQPGLRASLLAGPVGRFWAAASRAVRTPSRSYDSVTAIRSFQNEVLPLPLVGRLLGNTELVAEDLHAFEVGWRRAFADRLSLDVAAFLNSYDDLLMAKAHEPVVASSDLGQPYLLSDFLLGNDAEATTRGIEFVADLLPTEGHRIQVAYSYLHMDVRLGAFDPTAGEVGDAVLANNGEDSPRHQVVARYETRAWSRWEFGLAGRYASALPDPSGDFINRPSVPAVRELQARVAFALDSNAQLELIGRNLVDDGRVEFYDRTDVYPTGEVPRQVFLRLRWVR